MTNMALMQVDKLVETKGLDYLDREKAKRHARQQAEQMYDQQVLHCVFAVDSTDVQADCADAEHMTLMLTMLLLL